MIHLLLKQVPSGGGMETYTELPLFQGAPASLVQSQLRTSTFLIYVRLFKQNQLIQLTLAFANYYQTAQRTRTKMS